MAMKLTQTEFEKILKTSKYVPSLASPALIHAIENLRSDIEEQIHDIRPRWRKRDEIKGWTMNITVNDSGVRVHNQLTFWPHRREGNPISYHEVIDHPSITGMDANDLNLDFNTEEIHPAVGVVVSAAARLYIKIPEEEREMLKAIGNITTQYSSYDAVHCSI